MQFDLKLQQPEDKHNHTINENLNGKSKMQQNNQNLHGS